MESSERWERMFDVPVVVAALATIPLLVLQDHPPAPVWKTVATAGDWAVWGVFAAESAVLTARHGWSWIKSHPLDVAIVLLTFPLLAATLQGLRILRVLRLLWLLRAAPSARRVFSLQGLRWTSFLALVALLSGGEAFAQAENVPLGDGIYWAVSTMTTVGYGDYVPRTTTAKLVACLVMLVGVAFFAMVTGAIAQRFLAVEVRAVESEVEAVESEVLQVEGEIQQVEGVVERIGGSGDAAGAHPELLADVRDISSRLRRLEEKLSSLGG